MDYEKVPSSERGTTTEANFQLSDKDWCWFTLFMCLVLGLMLFGSLGPYPLFFSVIQESTSTQFYINSLKISSLDVAEADIKANFEVIFTIDNPRNWMNIFLREPKISVLYQNVTLSETNMASFYQEAGYHSLIKAHLAAMPVHVTRSLAHSIDSGRTWEKTVRFSVKFQSEVTINPGSSSERKTDMKLSCGDLEVEFLADGKSGRTWGTAWNICKFE